MVLLKMTISESNNNLGQNEYNISLPANNNKIEMIPVKTSKSPKSATSPQDNSRCCIICVGSTGTGKSSTVSKYTGVKTKAGSGTERVTKNCEIHRSLTDDQEPVWVDTVGWDDAECEDDQTFKDILMFINKYDITKVFNMVDSIIL